MKKSIIYTCTGDSGTTSLVAGKRVKKNDIRIEAYGTVDELSSHLGMLSAYDFDLNQNETITFIQNKLFNIGAYLATENEQEPVKLWGLDDNDIATLEKAIESAYKLVEKVHFDNAFYRHDIGQRAMKAFEEVK